MGEKYSTVKDENIYYFAYTIKLFKFTNWLVSLNYILLLKLYITFTN